MQDTPDYLVVGKHTKVAIPNLPMSLIAGFFCYGAILLFVVADLYASLFQKTYFKIFGIPPLKRGPFFQIDRHKLTKLSFIQKVNCVYCGYANGVVAYIKAVVNHLEVHSCAIKHVQTTPATKHQADFYEYNEFK